MSEISRHPLHLESAHSAPRSISHTPLQPQTLNYFSDNEYAPALTAPGPIKSKDENEAQIFRREGDWDGEDRDKLDEAGWPRQARGSVTPPPPRGPAVDSLGSPAVRETPLSRKEDAQRRRFESHTAEDRNPRLAEETRQVLIGLMPVKEFLNEFFPPIGVDRPMPNPEHAFDNVPVHPKSEGEISDALIEAITTKSLCPGVQFVDTSVSGRRDEGSLRPDITGYETKEAKLLQSAEPKQTQVSETGNNETEVIAESTSKPKQYEANLGLAETFFELKKDLDPFLDEHIHLGEPKNEKHFFASDNYSYGSKIGKARKAIFGQVVSYASDACARQHRMFYFSVLIVGTSARFFRWDRAGVIVTRSFDYRNQPGLMCEFLWRFGLANPFQRGFDPTVTVASPEERDLFKETISEEVAFQLGISACDVNGLETAVNVHYKGEKVTKVWIYNELTLRWEEYLVSVPVESPKSVTGRCTRAYWSVKIIKDSKAKTKGVVVFLKDSWRIDVPKMDDEGSMYEGMKEVVKKIPKVLAFGDVFVDPSFLYCNRAAALTRDDASRGATKPVETSYIYQCTRTQEFIQADWVCSCLRESISGEDDLDHWIVKHTHFRLVLDEVGYPLASFTGSRELFDGIRDAFEALESAYQMRQRLHRDVSVDNIILVRSRATKCREGRLVDWEFSTVANQASKGRDYFRSGTWAFMPGDALDNENKTFWHSHSNDLEAAFYVSMYCSLLWLPHNEVKDLGTWMHTFFDGAVVVLGRATGGQSKRDYIYKPEWFAEKFKFSNEHIQAWFVKAYQDLSTDAPAFKRIEGHVSNWTDATFRRHLDDVCQGLASLGTGESDRFEHKVEDYYAPKPTLHFATHTSVTSPSANTSSIHTSGIGVAGRVHRGSKRSLFETDDGKAGGSSGDGLRQANKRGRG